MKLDHLELEKIGFHIQGLNIDDRELLACFYRDSLKIEVNFDCEIIPNEEGFQFKVDHCKNAYYQTSADWVELNNPSLLKIRHLIDSEVGLVEYERKSVAEFMKELSQKQVVLELLDEIVNEGESRIQDSTPNIVLPLECVQESQIQ